jgi:peptide-methionine (S)-S-oxide reductase
MMRSEKAILAGGCFWGMEELIRALPGVTATVVGYTGGDVKNATYRNHGNHAEAIAITFNPDELPYRRLLEFFFQIHNPTTRNRQGNDIGASYRSAIFYLTEEHKNTAQQVIREIDASGKWPAAVVTEVVPATDFWDAEEEHQAYLQKHPYGYTCHYIRPEWQLPQEIKA